MPDQARYQIDIYVTEDGVSPFLEWLQSLSDRLARARVRVRLDRLSLGNFGDAVSLGRGLHELRIDYGPGYRVYFAVVKDHLVLMLAGSVKRDQQRQIRRARRFLANYKGRHR